MFHLSTYTRLIEGCRENNYAGRGVFSYTTSTFFPMSEADFNLLRANRVNELPASVQMKLLVNECIEPNRLDEVAMQVKRLAVFEKITILLQDNISSIDEGVLSSYIRQKKITNVFFIFLNPSTEDKLIEQISMLSQLLISADIPARVVRYFALAEENKPKIIDINEVRVEMDSLVSEPLHRQLILQHEDDLSLALSFAGDGAARKFGLSQFNDSFALPEPYDKRANRSRNQYQVTAVNSSYPYIKELPFTGLVVDADKTAHLFSDHIHSDCSSCKLLPACGGYAGNGEVHCPSYKSFENFYASTIDTTNDETNNASVSSAGVSNSLSLNKDITELFDKAIADNTSSQETILINYLNHKYNKGFRQSKSGANNFAALIFEQADELTNTLDPDSFSYKWIQTFATSTKSYLAFKIGGFKKAVAITDEGIQYAIQLQAYPSAEVMVLFIAQMLLNKAKVFLVAKQYQLWRDTMLENIHYLLNFERPASCAGLRIEQLKNIGQSLRYWLLMECINQVLKFNLTNKDCDFGNQVICNINITARTSLFDEQMNKWVSLNVAARERNVDYLSKNFSGFISERNQVVNISSMQGYLRTKIKPLVPLLQ